MRDHLKQGAREKTKETRLLEAMIKGILEEHAAGRKIAVSYNADREMMVQVGATSYNLTLILKHHPDWEQLEFTPTDIARFKEFLNDPATSYPEDPVLNKPAIRNQFPNLQLAELNAIRNYTGGFYTAINHVLRSNGTQEFPDPNTLKPGEFRKALEMFVQPGGSLDLNQLLTEVLLNTALSASALSKPIQDQMPLCTAPSVEALKKKIGEVKGISIVLIGEGDEREFVIVAYGKIITKQPYPKVSLDQLLDPAIAGGLDLSAAQIQTLRDALKDPAGYQEVLLDNLDPSKARLLARLHDAVGSEYFNPKEELFRADRPNPYMDAYVRRVRAGIDAQDMKESLQAPVGFSSTSAKLQDSFFQGEPGIVTHYTSPVGSLKNIMYLSKFLEELERLGIPGQEILHTAHKQDADGNVRLEAEFVRSLNLGEQRAEAEEAILKKAEQEIVALSKSIEKQVSAVVAEVEEKLKKAVAREAKLVDIAEEDSAHIKELRGQLDKLKLIDVKQKRLIKNKIEEIQQHLHQLKAEAAAGPQRAEAEVNEAREQISTIALKGVSVVERVGHHAEHDVSEAVRSNQAVVTQSGTQKIIEDSKKQLQQSLKLYSLLRPTIQNITAQATDAIDQIIKANEDKDKPASNNRGRV
ncbi:MAG: hypothetical protein K0R24_238 [Gammaproteobacteria bacterium]|jgi:hypothetical protein|nr:hypothetical protein [Gammaproteobacteria bacterium]